MTRTEEAAVRFGKHKTHASRGGLHHPQSKYLTLSLGSTSVSHRIHPTGQRGGITHNGKVNALINVGF